MILKHRVAIDGVYLDSLDNRIITQSVEESAPKYTQQTANMNGLLGGVREVLNRRDYLDVVVRFAINIKRDFEARCNVLDKVNRWAASGGSLTVNYRPWRILKVKTISMPAYGSPANWANDYTITFRAMNVPYWMDSNPVTLKETNDGGTNYINNAGNVFSVLEMSLKNTSANTINSVSISSGGYTIALASLGLLNGETLKVFHRDDGLLSIVIDKANGDRRSVISKRTAESSDDVYVVPGRNSVTRTADHAGEWVVSCYGRWL